MDQIQLLWNYQQADMTADRFEREMRKSPNRQKLLKNREFLLSQQEAMRRIEGEVEAMAERMEKECGRSLEELAREALAK